MIESAVCLEMYCYNMWIKGDVSKPKCLFRTLNVQSILCIKRSVTSERSRPDNHLAYEKEVLPECIYSLDSDLLILYLNCDWPIPVLMMWQSLIGY